MLTDDGVGAAAATASAAAGSGGVDWSRLGSYLVAGRKILS